MTHPEDTQVREAYDRLSRSLAGSDPLDGVRGRIRRRRTARRAGVAAASLVAVGGVLAGVALLGGASDGDVVAVDQPAPEPGPLVLTRGDGTEAVVDPAGLDVACRPAPDGTDLLIATRADLVDDVLADREVSAEVLGDLAFYVEVRVADVATPRTFTLPFDGPGDSDERPMLLFAAFRDPSAPGRFDEVNSTEPAARGTVTILEATCGAEPHLTLEVDGRLASEKDDSTHALRGSLRL